MMGDKLYRKCDPCDGTGWLKSGDLVNPPWCTTCVRRGFIKVEPTDRIKWCFAHDQELGQFLSVCDDEWRRNDRRARMGDKVENTCDIGDALLVRVNNSGY